MASLFFRAVVWSPVVLQVHIQAKMVCIRHLPRNLSKLFSSLAWLPKGRWVSRRRWWITQVLVKLLLTVLAEEPVGEAQLSGALVRISAAVVREQRVVPSGHGGHRPVVDELRAEAHHVLDPGHKRLDGVLYRSEEICKALEGSEGELAHGYGEENGKKDKTVEPHDGGCVLVEHRGGTARGFWGRRQHWVGGWL